MSSRSPLLKLIADLDRWGNLFLEVIRTKGVPATEQVVGGLVEWMGNDLLDGWLHLPIPLFDEVSGLAEELFQACQGYLAWIREAGATVSVDGRRSHEERVRAILMRVQALAARSVQADGS